MTGGKGRQPGLIGLYTHTHKYTDAECLVKSKRMTELAYVSYPVHVRTVYVCVCVCHCPDWIPKWDLFPGWWHGKNSLSFSLCVCASRLPRSLAPAGVRPLRALVQSSPPSASHAVPIGGVLARLVQVVPALVAVSCWVAPSIRRAPRPCCWSGGQGPSLLMPAEACIGYTRTDEQSFL